MVHTEMEQKNALAIKISFGDEIRRLSFSGTSFKMLVDEIKKLFNLKDEMPIVVKYQDDDKDQVTMSSDEELQTAIALCDGSVIRIQISRKFAKRSKFGEAEANSNSKEEKLENSESTKDDKQSWKERKEKIRQFKQKLQFMQQVRLVKDVTFADNSSLAPNTVFVKTWKIRNESEASWPEGCTLVFHKGDNMGNSANVPLPSLTPGQEYDISINLTSPSTYGKYIGVWRFTTPPFVNWNGETVQKKFGTPLKVKIIVSDSSSEKSESSSSSESEGTSDEEKSTKVKGDKKQKKELKYAKREEKRKNKEFKKKAKVEELAPLLLQLESMGFTDKQLNLRILFKTHADLDKAVVKLLKKKGKSQKK